MNNRLFFFAVTSALAGFLFGFDTVVISGAESKIQQLWSLSGTAHGLAISAALWGTVLGSLFGNIPATKFGRKNTLIVNGILFLVGALGSAVVNDVYTFFLFRFIGGIGIGMSTVAAPLYISEIAPKEHRGKLTGLFQFNIVFGILMAFFSNYVIGSIFDESTAWRYMLGIQALPAFLYTIMCLYIPESPRYLIINKNQIAEAIRIFKTISPEYTDEQIESLVSSVQGENQKQTQSAIEKVKFFTYKLRYPILFAFLIATFNQLSGINIILYFAPRLLGLAGVEDPVQASILLGVTNLVATFIGIRLIDMLGRKTLLIIGCVGYIASLSVCTYSFFSCHDLKVISAAVDVQNNATQVENLKSNLVYSTEKDKVEALINYDKSVANFEESIKNTEYDAIFDTVDVKSVKDFATSVKAKASSNISGTSITVLSCMIIFIASHAIGSGTIIWVFISEIFPNSVRAKGQSLGSFTHWIFAAMLTLIFPVIIANFETGYIFAFFSIMMIAQLIWCVLAMPETKGKSLEEISANLTR